ncbi:bifunctional DNA-formamidopyrimidine glycosylase/DNA-(apurinic or apyrimidinic site) lyase [Corynebacterium tapiri]|uniref:Formamidopyrimidine-DNA glycosylase n=1 Tax=Corynebacterium tapiri TaxID=1448266 RepID=A0A5C4U5H4_9CORY|nr:bifunctional DNA-formamidopyrimidine glycosylase/DNA-(apurinic or apyrimidinic site) lyase [Corynebacterium tapiri]TNL99338.1 bifunctional DNA-formamidopyrimidine glycosylase/DNA-(apurinic or apyrimidinic site) lyase [Corynebacterium tapiri]
MPELPEVEVVRRGLDTHVVGGRFISVEVSHPRATRGQGQPIEELLEDRTITGTGRRGKYLWLNLDDGNALYVHLGMSGQMLVGAVGECTAVHTRIRAQLDFSGQVRELAFVDQRTFGQWLVCPLIDGVPTPVAHVAPDPFDAEFDIVEAARSIRRRRSSIKTVLLNQTVVSGIGNIYADEALWQARISPFRPAHSLRQKDAVGLLEAARQVMTRALEAGGTSFDSLYVNVNGASGYFSRSLNAYGQTGAPCARCGEAIARAVIQNRSAHYCPRCQSRSHRS